MQSGLEVPNYARTHYLIRLHFTYNFIIPNKAEDGKRKILSIQTHHQLCFNKMDTLCFHVTLTHIRTKI